VPIPVLLLDEGRRITFLNEAVGKISAKYRELKGKECASIFPDGKVGQQVESLVKTVCFNRQIQVIEAIIKIGDSKIWGRVHLQPLRWGSDTSVLALIEDLTLEKSQLVLQKKMRKELEKRVEDRTADLARINERLQQEVGERKRAEAELITHRNNLEQLVVGRTRELNATIARMKQEVKERKKAESSLRASESRLQLAFHANPGAVSIVSLKDGKYLDANATFCRFSGYTHDEIIGRTDDELNYWAHSGLRESMIQTLKETGKVNHLEAVFRSKSGKMRVGSVSAEIIELDQQPYILSAVMDITEQKRAERDQNLFAAAIDHVGESVLISDARGVIKYANSAFEAASGYFREEIRGQNIGIIRSPESDKNALAELNLGLKDGKPWQGRLINRRRNGSSYEVETSVIPVMGKSSRAMNFVMVEREARAAAPFEEQLEQASTIQSLATMAAGIAGELNDILAASSGNAHLAKEKLEPDSPVRHDLDRLIKAGERAADLAMRTFTAVRRALE
jgi:PAS domain S-box-containing protein